MAELLASYEEQRDELEPLIASRTSELGGRDGPV